MEAIDHPIISSVVCFCLMLLASFLGDLSSRKRRPMEGAQDQSFRVIEAASLTLLGLIVGFTFSMAVSRYDLRKNYEEAEANAIGTEYVRADLLDAADGARVRAVLVNYLDQRLLFYTAQSEKEVEHINLETGRLQSALWSAVQPHAGAQGNAVMALAISGANDVLNSQGYTQAAWWNGIPPAAWCLMVAIAVACNFLVGFGARSPKATSRLHLVLPLVLSITLLLIADIAAPRHGFIRVVPQNLVALRQSLQGPGAASGPVSQ